MDAIMSSFAVQSESTLCNNQQGSEVATVSLLLAAKKGRVAQPKAPGQCKLIRRQTTAGWVKPFAFSTLIAAPENAAFSALIEAPENAAFSALTAAPENAAFAALIAAPENAAFPALTASPDHAASQFCACPNSL